MEWMQRRVKSDTATYAERAVPLFKKKLNFAAHWSQLANQAGCRYLMFTTKHHDGFLLHDSKVSVYDAGSVLGRDLVREIVEDCLAEGNTCWSLPLGHRLEPQPVFLCQVEAASASIERTTLSQWKSGSQTTRRLPSCPDRRTRTQLRDNRYHVVGLQRN